MGQFIVIAAVLIGAVVLLCLLWLNTLATAAIWRTKDLNTSQKIIQAMFVWVLPLFAAWLVLHLLAEHDGEAIPRSWIVNERINAYILQGLRIQSDNLTRTSRTALENEAIETLTETFTGGSGTQGDSGGD